MLWSQQHWDNDEGMMVGKWDSNPQDWKYSVQQCTWEMVTTRGHAGDNNCKRMCTCAKEKMMRWQRRKRQLAHAEAKMMTW